MASGGKRVGSGRKNGSKGKATLEKQAITDAFNQRIMLHADDLFNAQYKLAVGAQKVFRVDEVGSGKDKKRLHSQVVDSKQIIAFLDKHDGMDGTVDDVYYYIQTADPDNRALDSLLNRGLGKPVEKKEVTGKDGGPVEHKVIKIELTDD